jgi:hypothetical protein
VKLTFFPPSPILDAVLVLGPYGLVYFGITITMRVPEAASIAARLKLSTSARS